VGKVSNGGGKEKSRLSDSIHRPSRGKTHAKEHNWTRERQVFPLRESIYARPTEGGMSREERDFGIRDAAKEGDRLNRQL